ncbi:SURF1 family protein [Frigidibacter sp. MR17.14]|uniref:SURF1 family protein n=1 Tax=Frigidibacter sp. MR17.14 TaxID=3126509 RepID=UPI003012DC84
MRRYLFPLILGCLGCAILVELGLWQLRRLEWKTAVLERIEAQMAAQPGHLPPAAQTSEAAKYQPVRLQGTTGAREIHMLTGVKGEGAGYEIITPFETGGRTVLLDRGFVAEAAKEAPRPPVQLTVLGTLHWPDEKTSSTPEPDLGRNIWFARDVPAMAAALGTEPVLVVAREVTGEGQGVTPVPVTTLGIPNDHLNYAITWFSLAAVWAGMTVYLLWRIRRRTM